MSAPAPGLALPNYCKSLDFFHGQAASLRRSCVPTLSYNGTELTIDAVPAWCAEIGIEWQYTRRASQLSMTSTGALTAGCAMSSSVRRGPQPCSCSPRDRGRSGGLKPGETGVPLAKQHRRSSPPNGISNDKIRLRPCATKRSGSNPSWRKAGKYVSDQKNIAHCSVARFRGKVKKRARYERA